MYICAILNVHLWVVKSQGKSFPLAPPLPTVSSRTTMLICESRKIRFTFYRCTVVVGCRKNLQWSSVAMRRDVCERYFVISIFRNLRYMKINLIPVLSPVLVRPQFEPLLTWHVNPNVPESARYYGGSESHSGEEEKYENDKFSSTPAAPNKKHFNQIFEFNLWFHSHTFSSPPFLFCMAAQHRASIYVRRKMLFNSIRVNELKFNLFYLRVSGMELNANCGISR